MSAPVDILEIAARRQWQARLALMANAQMQATEASALAHVRLNVNCRCADRDVQRVESLIADLSA